MVPKVAGKGRSFMGAGLYYLHDKKAETSERVAFTHTVNLPTRDPDKAIRLMAYTAMHQSEIKARAGGSTRGRKLADPVYCYSLSWAPGEDPTEQEMIDAAQETLKALGLEGHEALLVGHNDEPHPHIHVIVNRVNPETGIAAPLKMDHLKLSTWAEAFERRQGQIRCEQRVENNELRRNGEFVKDRGSQKAAEFQRWRMERAHRRSDKRVREAGRLDTKHAGEGDQLQNRRDQLIAEQRGRFREATRGDWRDLFAIQRQERRRFADAQRNAWSRVRFDIRTHGENYRKAGKSGRKEMLKGAASALVGSKAQKAKLELKQKNERLFFAGKLKKRADKLTEKIREKHKRDLAEVRKRQETERHKLQMRQSKESQAEAREFREGRDKDLFRKEQRGQLRHELIETKRDVTGPSAAEEKRPSSLAERFAKAGRSSGKQPDKAIVPEEPKVSKRETSFREQAEDLTAKKDRGQQSLADKFRKAQERSAGAKKDSRDQFKDNADDVSKDMGRERNKKPPK